MSPDAALPGGALQEAGAQVHQAQRLPSGAHPGTVPGPLLPVSFLKLILPHFVHNFLSSFIQEQKLAEAYSIAPELKKK